jgi:hypothetical protein
MVGGDKEPYQGSIDQGHIVEDAQMTIEKHYYTAKMWEMNVPALLSTDRAYIYRYV